MSLDVSALILKMQQCPKLEAGIRNRDVYAIMARLLLSLGQERMFINVENAPDSIVLQIVILTALGIPVCSFLEIDGPFDQRLWRSARLDLQLNKTFCLVSKVIEVVSLGHLAFTNDQDSSLYLSKGATTTETIPSLRHRVQ